MEKSSGANLATTRAAGQAGTKTLNSDGSTLIPIKIKDKGFAPRGIRLAKHLRKGFNFVKWAGKKIPGYIFRMFTQQEKGCVVCGTPLTYNNSKQMRLYCSKRCRWARHNPKYLNTSRGHK